MAVHSIRAAQFLDVGDRREAVGGIVLPHDGAACGVLSSLEDLLYRSAVGLGSWRCGTVRACRADSLGAR